MEAEKVLVGRVALGDNTENRRSDGEFVLPDHLPATPGRADAGCQAECLQQLTALGKQIEVNKKVRTISPRGEACSNPAW